MNAISKSNGLPLVIIQHTYNEYYNLYHNLKSWITKYANNLSKTPSSNKIGDKEYIELYIMFSNFINTPYKLLSKYKCYIFDKFEIPTHNLRPNNNEKDEFEMRIKGMELRQNTIDVIYNFLNYFNTNQENLLLDIKYKEYINDGFQTYKKLIYDLRNKNTIYK